MTPRLASTARSAPSAPHGPTRVRVWVLAMRPATLPAAASGVIVGLGAALADGVPFRLLPAVLCLAVALLLQIAANLANDLADFQRGADRPDRLGPMRVAAAGLVSVRALEVGVGISVGLAALAGLGLARIGGPLVLGAGACAIVALLAYTGGPWPYGYHALGDVFVFCFFGFVAVAGTAFLQAGHIDGLFIVAALPVGFLTTAILVVNNLRDVDSDAAAGKCTLAVALGTAATRREFVGLICGAYFVTLGLVAVRGLPLALPFITLPLAVALLRQVRNAVPRNLNAALAATARLDLVFALSLAVGLALAR